MILSKKILTSLAFITCLHAGTAIAVQNDLSTMNEARKLYEKNKLSEAIETYNKISKASDFWTDAVEEKAWAYVRQDNYDQALAELKSVLNPTFLPFSSPETVMLATFVDLKICDYKGVFDKIKKFKETMQPRAQALESIVTNSQNEIALKWINTLSEKSVKISDLGKDITSLPRYFYRDVELQKHAKNKNTRKAMSRMQSLAKRDLKEISKNLNKMKIIEIETIQRSYVQAPEKPEGNLKFAKVSKDALVFPDEMDKGEIWLDEVGNYEVKTLKCPTKSGGRS